jgi:hypothetical protein
MYVSVSKSVTFPTPHIGHSRHGISFTRLDCQSNALPSEKDHDLPGIRTQDLRSSSQHTQPLHHLVVLHVRNVLHFQNKLMSTEIIDGYASYTHLALQNIDSM